MDKFKYNDASITQPDSRPLDIHRINFNIKAKFTKWNWHKSSTGAYYINRYGMKKILDFYIRDNKIDFKNPNILGAGDHFAASIINDMISKKSKPENMLKKAHKFSSDYCLGKL